MKELFLVLCLSTFSGCSLLANNQGWNPSGYIYKNQNIKAKIGFIDTNLIYDNAQRISEDKIYIEEDLKEQQFIFGARLEIKF